MTTELATTSTNVPQSYTEINSFAAAFVSSGMFQDTRQIAQAVVKIQAGRELGLPPVYSMQNINLIRGRLTSSANVIALLIKKSGRYNYRIKEHTDKVCTITFYEADGGKWTEIGVASFSMDDAKRADLVKPDSGWMKYPKAMLFARAISSGGRMYAPDAIGGIYTDEEIRSIPPKPSDDTAVDTSTGDIVTPTDATVSEAQPAKTEIPIGTPFKSNQIAMKATKELADKITELRAKGHNIEAIARSKGIDPSKPITKQMQETIIAVAEGGV